MARLQQIQGYMWQYWPAIKHELDHIDKIFPQLWCSFHCFVYVSQHRSLHAIVVFRSRRQSERLFATHLLCFFHEPKTHIFCIQIRSSLKNNRKEYATAILSPKPIEYREILSILWLAYRQVLIGFLVISNCPILIEMITQTSPIWLQNRSDEICKPNVRSQRTGRCLYSQTIVRSHRTDYRAFKQRTILLHQLHGVPYSFSQAENIYHHWYAR